MSTDEAASQGAGKSGSKSRIILILVLVVAVVLLVVDLRARNAAADLDSQLNDMLEKAPARQKPSIEEVHEAVGREPDEEYEMEGVADTKIEEYQFQGALRKYVVYCAYSTRKVSSSIACG